jgi:D-alanyl-D-alanine dipeptidase
MLRSSVAALLLVGLVAASDHRDSLVDATRAVPALIVELRYATPNNFLKRSLYPAQPKCLLLPVTAEKLRAVAQSLKPVGLRLKAYDCYRPLSVQWEMWKIFPKPGYVADPRKGSNHNRGAAIDLTLARADGSELEMPTPFDTFSPSSHQSFQGGSETSRKNRDLLREKMVTAGFSPNPMEWWHFDLPDAARYPVRDERF